MNAIKTLVPTLAVLLALPGTGRAQAPDTTAADTDGGSAQQIDARSPGGRGRRAVRRSWTSSRTPLREGDILAIIVDEQTLATADLRELRDSDRSRDFDLLLGLPGGSIGGALGLGNDSDERSRGEATRRERFSAEISARVIEVGPGGMARIEGVKRVQIDKHSQAITVRGWVRSADVTLANTVPSWRVADAEVLYESNGELQRAPGGVLAKLFDYIW